MIPAAVLGASGFLGGELIRLLWGHPGFELVAVGARQTVGRPVGAVHPHLRACRLLFEDLDAGTAAGRARLVFTALPTAVSAQVVPQLLEAGVETVIDLSPAYRLDDEREHRRWYPEARRDPQLARMAVYGLPELSREGLGSARLVASAGCFATATTLALLPLLQLPEVCVEQVAVDAKSGSTGSGARPRLAGMHPLRAQVIRPYAPTGHRHVPEIRRALRAGGVADGDVRVGMSAYAVDAVRGLLSSAYLFTDAGLSVADVRHAVRATYRDEPFVRAAGHGHGGMPLPDPRALAGSNFCDVGGFYDADAGRVILIAALDNLVKGGAGQALQAANIRYGIPETTGLEQGAVYP